MGLTRLCTLTLLLTQCQATVAETGEPVTASSVSTDSTGELTGTDSTGGLTRSDVTIHLTRTGTKVDLTRKDTTTGFARAAGSQEQDLDNILRTSVGNVEQIRRDATTVPDYSQTDTSTGRVTNRTTYSHGLLIEKLSHETRSKKHRTGSSFKHEQADLVDVTETSLLGKTRPREWEGGDGVASTRDSSLSVRATSQTDPKLLEVIKRKNRLAWYLQQSHQDGVLLPDNSQSLQTQATVAFITTDGGEKTPFLNEATASTTFVSFSSSPVSIEPGATDRTDAKTTQYARHTSSDPIIQTTQLVAFNSVLPRKDEDTDIQEPLTNLNVSQETINTISDEDSGAEKSRNQDICPLCNDSNSTEESVRLLKLSMFAELIAKKLRLDSHYFNRPGFKPYPTTPRHTEQIKLPSSFVEQMLKDNRRALERDDFHARDQEVIVAGEDMGRDCIKLHVTGCFSFNLKGRIRREVAAARIWLYKMVDANDVNGQTFIAYELERLKSGRVAPSSLMVSVDTMVSQDWVVLNVTRSLRYWVSRRQVFQMVALRCSTCSYRNHKPLFGVKEGYKPLLVVTYVPDNLTTRHKRSATCDPRVECCKRELQVNFQDIGLPDIIQPQELNVGYCFGACNDGQQFPYNHTTIRHQARASPQHAALLHQLRACCVPTVLKDIFIMTSDGHGLIVRKLLPKVVVESCGCV